MMRYLAPLFLIASLGGICGAAAGETAPGFFTLYSDICLNSGSGDLHGMRVGIMDLPDANYVFFQTAESWTQTPQVIQLPSRVMNASRIVSSKLEFPMTGDDNKRHVFEGTLSPAAIDGGFGVPGISGKTVHHLKRVEASKNFVSACP